MASTLQHLTVAIKINDRFLKYKDTELTEYLLGSIACDAPKIKLDEPAVNLTNKKTPDNTERKSERAFTHLLRPSIYIDKKNNFIDKATALKYGYDPVDDKATSPVCYKQFCPMIKYFLDKYKKYLNEPFMVGYLVHLITDDIYFKDIMPLVISKKVLEIDNFMNNAYDNYSKKEYLSNGEYLEWTHHAMYSDYSKYNDILVPMYYEKIPNFYNLAKYLINWEESNEKFKPSMVEDLNDKESIIYFIENANNTAKNIEIIKEKIKNNEKIEKPNFEVLTYEYYEMLENMATEEFVKLYNINK